MFTVRFWFYFVASGTKYFESDQGAMKSQVYRYEKKKKKCHPVIESLVSVAGYGPCNSILTQNTAEHTQE